MVSRGRIQNHGEGEYVAFVTHNKKKKRKRGPSNSGDPPPRNSKRMNERETLHIECYNCHKKGHYARDCPKMNKGLHYNTRSNNNKFNNRRIGDDRRNECNGRYERRRRDAMNDHEENHCPQNKSRSTKYESNVANQSEYILIIALSSSSPLETWDHWLVDNGASHHFSG